ncbi:MAG: hypothetical protein Kow00105_03950 [Phycisphaeraceae bacterium]
MTVGDKAGVPAMTGGIGFNAQHAPMGAFMSFTCGCPDAGCGLGVEIGRPAGQNVFVGVKCGGRCTDAPIRCLPFYRDAGAEAGAASNYDVENPNASRAMRGLEMIPLSEVKRHYGWASDSWVMPGFTFRVFSPFGAIPDPGLPGTTTAAMRRALLPAVNALLEIDNRGGDETMTGVFAIDFIDPGARLLWHDTGGGRGSAVAYKRQMGLAARLKGGAPSDRLNVFQEWAVADGLQSPDPVHGLGTCAGFYFEVKPGERKALVLALGVYLDGIVTTGIEGRYLYTRYFAGLEDVLETALDQFDLRRSMSEALDRELLDSGLSVSQQFQLAHATRGYYGSTQLLSVSGDPLWVVNEGEYCMMNTLDLSIDHAFWELRHNPWVVRNLLDRFADRYRYQDRVKGRDGQEKAGGVSFTHDMGANNNFSRPGHSSYERPERTGCFSYMTQEQLCNWVLLAGCYVAATGDEKWLDRRRDLLQQSAWSMRNRADEATGVMACDSTRCGGGGEITTYDSLDESLGQARANTYIAVKCWASWLALEMLGAASQSTGDGSLCPSLADTIADHLCASVKPDGTLPAVLEKDNPGYGSRIIPVVEALVYPDYWQKHLARREADPESRRRLAAAMRHPMLGVLGRHAKLLLEDARGRNVFEDGGLRLSSTSGNSWMSKIALCQYVIREVLHLTDDNPTLDKLMQRADRAHALWQIEGSAYWASSDQFIHGVAKGSRYYPRMVTAVLWLDETPAARAGGTRQGDEAPDTATTVG